MEDDLGKASALSELHTPDSFYGGLSAAQMPSCFIPAEFLSSLDSEQTFHSDLFNSTPLMGNLTLDGTGASSSYLDSDPISQSFHHSIDQTELCMGQPLFAPIGLSFFSSYNWAHSFLVLSCCSRVFTQRQTTPFHTSEIPTWKTQSWSLV